MNINPMTDHKNLINAGFFGLPLPVRQHLAEEGAMMSGGRMYACRFE